MMSKIVPEPEIEAELQSFGPVFGELVLCLRIFHGHINPIQLSSCCPNLKFLEIVGHVGLHESQLSSLVTHLPNLRYLRISNAGASQEFWVDFLRNIQNANIKEFDLSSNE
jgi:hypothetical protein